MNRKIFRFVLPAVLLSLTALAQNNGGGAAPANPTGGTKIGVIDIQQAIMATNEGQRDFTALQKKFEPKQSELNTLNKEIESLKQQLQTQGDKLNDAARGDLVKSIESKQKTLQRQAEDAQSDFQSQQGEIANRIGGKMLQLIDKFAKERKYSVIVDVSGQASPVLWADAQTNITKEIVDSYNAQSGVAAPTPAAGAPSAPSASRPPASRPAGSTAAPKSAAAAPKK